MIKVTINDRQSEIGSNAQDLLSPVVSGFEINLNAAAQKFAELQIAARKLVGLGYNEISLEGTWSAEQQYAFAQGFLVPHRQRTLHYAECRKKADKHWLTSHISVLTFVREMVNMSPEELSPERLALLSSRWLHQLSNEHIQTNIICGEQLREQGYHGIYHVGRGSDRSPAMLEIDFNPSGSDCVDIALVGKGITFDSGGYSLKASEGMLDMKGDMAGAATVVGALGLAIMNGLNKRVKLFLCCAENLVSGHAYKLGDIITYKDGTTVEIVNTDAEGRLVLADGLLAARDAGAAVIIDAATLTGAAMMAVGPDYNALFSRHTELAATALKFANETNEPLWQLPLESFHQNKCPSPFADTANSRPQKGGGPSGASNAAGFLSRFVDMQKSQWLHFDLAAAYARNGTERMAEGGSGLGIRTIAKLLLD